MRCNCGRDRRMDPAWREQRAGGKKVGGWRGKLNPFTDRRPSVIVGESATAYTLQKENFSRGGADSLPEILGTF